jgi:hypothetical protein
LSVRNPLGRIWGFDMENVRAFQYNVSGRQRLKHILKRSVRRPRKSGVHRDPFMSTAEIDGAISCDTRLHILM